MPWSSGIHRAEGVIQGAFHSPLNSGIFFYKVKWNEPFQFGWFDWNVYLEYLHWSGHFGRLDMSLSI